MEHSRRYLGPALLSVIIAVTPLALSAQAGTKDKANDKDKAKAKAEYPYIVNLRTLNDNGHQEVYTTYYPTNDREKKEKLDECKALAPKVVGRPDSNYRSIISSSCTVDR